MKRILPRLLLVGVLVVAAVLAWRHFFPGPEAQIRRRMAELQELISFSGSEGNFAAWSGIQRVGSLLTEDAQIRVDVPGEPRGILRGRQSILLNLEGARRVIDGLKVEFLDVTVVIAEDGRSAVVEATGKALPGGSTELWVQDLRFHFIETPDGWLIESVETVRTLTGRGLPPVHPGEAPRAA